MASKKPHEIDRDGWPLNLPSETEQMAEIERHFQQDMRAFEARWRAGDLTAVAEAVRVCRLHGKAPPEWLEQATAVLTKLAMDEEEKRLRRRWKVHRTRWEMVTELCERQRELSRTGRVNLERARELIAVKATNEKEVGERARLIELFPVLVEAAGYDWGTSSARAHEIVSEALGEGHSPGAIKRSCKIVEDAGGERASFEDYLAILRERGERDDD